MKQVIKNITYLALSLALLAPAAAFAEDEGLKKDFNALGGNEDIISRARELDPDNRVRIVQNRLVDRHYRLELGVNFGTVAGGDSYLNTNNLGANVDFHITPRWSLGARWYRSYNTLTSQGEKAYEQAEKENAQDPTRGSLPEVDYPINTTLAVINFYPIYGKLNLFDMGVSQFDVYGLAGYGQVQLGSGSSPTYTIGTGVGLWLNQYISSRVEVRYQRYQDQVYSGTRDLDLTVFTASLGWIL